MPTVEILVNGRRHEMQCGEGEESRLRQLASYVDRRIADLAKGQSQIGDARLLLMASLVVADELSDAFDEIKRLRPTLEGQGAGDGERQAASALEQAAQQIQAIAAELERA
jgi:cell division protein ZapA